MKGTEMDDKPKTAEQILTNLYLDGMTAKQEEIEAMQKGARAYIQRPIKAVIKPYIDDLIAIVGEETDLETKYEGYFKLDPETGEAGIITEIDDEESVGITGEKLAMLANFVSDKTKNHIIDDLRGEKHNEPTN